MYGSSAADEADARGDRPRRSDGGSGAGGKRSKRLVISNLHYDVSERELEVRPGLGARERDRRLTTRAHDSTCSPRSARSPTRPASRYGPRPRDPFTPAGLAVVNHPYSLFSPPRLPVVDNPGSPTCHADSSTALAAQPDSPSSATDRRRRRRRPRRRSTARSRKVSPCCGLCSVWCG